MVRRLQWHGHNIDNVLVCEFSLSGLKSRTMVTHTDHDTLCNLVSSIYRKKRKENKTPAYHGKSSCFYRYFLRCKAWFSLYRMQTYFCKQNLSPLSMCSVQKRSQWHGSMFFDTRKIKAFKTIFSPNTCLIALGWRTYLFLSSFFSNVVLQLKIYSFTLLLVTFEQCLVLF